ncbi:MAG: hypothetical protein JWP30_789 [Homoserinimonas sp.]|jgi:hypothetical protein|nr:hypothetical protein [Homoserinimonas sp.]
MKIYSDFRVHRTRQVASDILGVAAIGFCMWLGVQLYQVVVMVGQFGVQLQGAGSQFERAMADAGNVLARIPLVGVAIRSPFDGASEAGGALADAGRSQQDAVHQLAPTLAVGVAVLPTLMVLAVWFVPRVRFARRAGSVRKLLAIRGGADLLALRTLTSAKSSALLAVDVDPVAAWRRGDTSVIALLAQLELRSSGVRDG